MREIEREVLGKGVGGGRDGISWHLEDREGKIKRYCKAHTHKFKVKE